MQVQLDLRTGIPIYIQIMDQIKSRIASGELKPGDQLPTVRQMASDLRVNFNTVARAYRLLDEAGLISTQHGRGTYILSAPSEAATEMLKDRALLGLTLNYLRQAQQKGGAPAEIRAVLEEYLAQWEAEGDLPQGDPV